MRPRGHLRSMIGLTVRRTIGIRTRSAGVLSVRAAAAGAKSSKVSMEQAVHKHDGAGPARIAEGARRNLRRLAPPMVVFRSAGAIGHLTKASAGVLERHRQVYVNGYY